MDLNRSLTYPFRILQWTTRPPPSLTELTSSSLKLILFTKAFIYYWDAQITIYVQWRHSSHTLQYMEGKKDICLSQKKVSFLQDNIFSTKLRRVLHIAGMETTHYNTHIFHIGTTTLARQAGISDGKMVEHAYETYISTPREQLAPLSKQLFTSNCNNYYKSLHLFSYCH